MQYLSSAVFLTLGFAATLSSAATCAGLRVGQEAKMSSSDLQALAVALETNTLSSGLVADSILIKATHSVLFTAGSAQACVHNDYLTQNAHYNRKDISYAIAQSYFQCCKSDDKCKAEPWYQIKGDTGLTAIVSISAAGTPCKSPNANGSGALAAGEIAGKTGKLFYDIFKAFH